MSSPRPSALAVLLLLGSLCVIAPDGARAGDAPFAAQQVVALSADQPTSIAVGDLDGDGDADLVSASIADGKLAWRENQSDLQDGISWGPEHLIADGLAFKAVLIFDADGDGDLDVLGGIDGPQRPRWYENADGAGSFQLGQEITVAADQTTLLAAADVDRDGDVDIVGADGGLLPEIRVYPNAGDGTFSTYDFVGSTGASFLALSLTDLDGDGDLEILSGAASNVGEGTALVWWQSVGANWVPHGIGLLEGIDALDAADLDRDGDLDVLVAHDQTVSWLENVGPGAVFPLAASLLYGDKDSSFSEVRAADLDGDGDLDVVAAAEDSGIRWFENQGGVGDFAPGTIVQPNLAGRTALAVVDVERDGDLDLISASADDDKIAVYRNKKIHRSARFAPQLTLAEDVEASALVCEDLNLDGTPDLIYADTWSESVRWSPNLDGFNSAIEFSVIDDVQTLDVADFEGDGSPDVVSGARGEGRLAWHPNEQGNGPDGYLSISESFSEGYQSLRAADMDGDGDPDVVTGIDLSYSGSYGEPNVLWWENDGSPAEFPDWPVHPIGNVGDLAWSVAPSDLDRDGQLDVIVGAEGFGNGLNGELVWFRADHGTFWQLPIAESPGAVRWVATGDLDGDGDEDVLSARDSGLYWNANELPGAGWPEHPIATDIDSGRFVAASDLDHDGDLDVLSGSTSDYAGAYGWYENENGAGSFGARQVIGEIYGRPNALVGSDVDRDGDPDALGASFGDGKGLGQVALYTNEGGQFGLGTTDLVPAVSFDGQFVPLLAISMTVNSRPGDSVGRLATLALGFDAGADADADAVQFDLAAAFNADVIVNNGNGLDPTQQPVDAGFYASDNFAFMTQSAAQQLCSAPGIPDDGFFPANADHPDVQLAYRNDDDGDNVRRSAFATDSFFIAVPPDHYTEVHLFATTGDGSSSFQATLIYADESSQTVPFTVPDWFDGPSAGAYFLVDDLERVNVGVPPGDPFACNGSYAAAIFGFPLAADPARTLVGVQVDRLDSSSVSNIFGATGLRFQSAALDSAAANALIDELRVYRDDGSGQFEPGADTLVETIETLDLDAGGFQTLTLPESPELIVALPATFLLVARLTPNASAQPLHAFRVKHLAQDSTAENNDTASELLAEPPLGLAYPAASTKTEVQPAYAVDSPDDDADANPGDSICATVGAACTLRAAIQEANARVGDDLILVPAELGPYFLIEPGPLEDNCATGDLDIANNGALTIRGEGPGRPVIDAGGLDRVFDVQDGATATLEGLTISGGDAQTEDGGGIRTRAGGNLKVERCTIEGNLAAAGGGIATADGSLASIAHSTISANSAATSGGGLSIGAAGLTLRDSTVALNDAPAGGALHTALGVWTVSNSTVSGNTTSGPSSAAIDGGQPGSTFSSATITANVGGGIAGSLAAIGIGNSLVAANDVDLSGDFASLGYNLIGDLGSATGFTDGVDGDRVGGAGTPIVPLVAPLADNGGPTSTHALLPGSPALDAGRCPGLALDQRGEPRAVDLPTVDDVPGGDRCDIGALETTYGSLLLPLEIPVRWCAVAGAPSANDPGLVGADTISDVLRQRIDRATQEILEPNAGIVLRSGATALVASFPVLADRLAVGQPGDVFIEPETANFDEFLQLIADCRAAWEALDPTVVGITAVQINQFVDHDGTPLPILGLGGRAGQNNAAEQLAAGRVMVVDRSYRLGEDPFDSLLAHEAGHAFSLEHGNGRDDHQPPDEIIDNDDDKLAGLPKFDGPNLMQYRRGTDLTQGQVERARTHAFVTIPDSTINLAGVMTDNGTIDPGLSRVLDFGFSKVLDFNLDDIQDFGLSKVLDFGFSKVLDFGLSKVLDFGFSKVLDFGFSRVLDFGMTYGAEGLEGSATLASTTGGVFWPSPIRPDQTLMYYLNVDNDEGTGGDPAAWDFPSGGSALGIDLIVEVHISSSCTQDSCTDQQTAKAFRFVDQAIGYVVDDDAVAGNQSQIKELTVGLVVADGGEEVEIDDQRMAAMVTTQLKSGVLVEAGAKIGAPLVIETLSFVDCATDLPGGSSTIPLDCQCTSCANCPDYPGCNGVGGTPDDVPPVLLVDTAVGLVTFDPPALPQCTATPSVAAPGATVVVSAIHFTPGEGLQLAVDQGPAVAFDGPQTTQFVIPQDTAAAKLELQVDLADPQGTQAQVARCSVVVNTNACGDDGDHDGCDDCSIVPTGDPLDDGPDFDADGLCDAGDPDDDDDSVLDPLDPRPRDPLVCGSSDDDACDDCSSGTFNPQADGDDTDGDGICDEGDTDDDSDQVDDLQDAQEDDPLVCGDTDHDGCDDCSLAGSPAPAADGIDTDHDGICSIGDPDDDNPSACGDFGDHDGCDDCSQGSFDPASDGPDGDLDGICNVTDTCTDSDHDGLGNGNLQNAECLNGSTDHDDGNPNVCADTNLDGCDDCSSGSFDPVGNGVDGDQDGLCDGTDNCPTAFNPHQADFDFDGAGNECDTCTDRDGDGWGTDHFPANDCGDDNCPWIANPGQQDSDNDGVGNPCEQPKIQPKPSSVVLWPPNHRMVDVEIELVTDLPTESLSVVLIRAASDEPDEGRGDGLTTEDLQDVELGGSDLHVRLRAERSSLGEGRNYVLLYEVTDTLTGLSMPVAVEIVVPLTQDGGTEPLLLGLAKQGQAVVVQWTEVPGASHYDVIRGDLAALHELSDRIDLGPVICLAEGKSTSTSAVPDAELPQPDQAFFYLAQYHKDGQNSSYGTESCARPRVPSEGACK